MSLSAGEERELRALQRRKQRERSGRFLAEGVRVVEDLIGSQLRVLWAVTSPSLESTERGSALAAELDRRAVRRRTVGDAEFALLAATERPQGVMAVAEVPSWGLADLSPTTEREVVLVLDAVQDPGNFGTLVRSAEALGARGIIALPGTVDPWNPKSIRAAVGSSFRVPVVGAEWEEASAWLRENGFRTLAAEMGGAEPPHGLARAALVVGNEGAGLSAAVLSGVDGVVGVPLRGRAESLNVAAAAAILLYELTR